MARQANGHASAQERPSFRQASLRAVQDLIGAMSASETSTARFKLGEYEVFLFAVGQRETRAFGLRKPRARGKTRAMIVADSPGAPAGPSVSLNDIIATACRLVGVSRSHLASKSRSWRLSLARALIAGHASRLRAASLAEVAAQMRVNTNSLYAAIGRSRKRMPDLFAMSWQRFVEMSKDPSGRVMLNKKWLESNTMPPSDAEIGVRIAQSLPRPED